MPLSHDLDVEALYRRERDAVFAFAVGLVGSRAVAEDVVAEAFEKVLRKAHRYDPRRGSERGWLFQIVRNTALDQLRRQRRQHSLEGELQQVLAQASPVPEFPELQAALAQLPENDRVLLYLRFWVDLEHAEIAQALGISATNASTRLSRVTSRLAQTLNQQETTS